MKLWCKDLWPEVSKRLCNKRDVAPAYDNVLLEPQQKHPVPVSPAVLTPCGRRTFLSALQKQIYLIRCVAESLCSVKLMTVTVLQVADGARHYEAFSN